MKYTFLVFALALFATACQKEEINEVMMESENSDPDHHALEDIIDHLPFDQFNDFTRAVFRNSAGEEIIYRLSLEEEIVEKQSDKGLYSTNEFTFKYENIDGLFFSNFSFVASLEYFDDLEFVEAIICNVSIFVAGSGITKLTIIPNQNYNNTVLNEEFIWLGEEYMNVYSNILIEENEFDNTKLFYQSATGIIGFVDNSNRSWGLDRFE